MAKKARKLKELAEILEEHEIEEIEKVDISVLKEMTETVSEISDPRDEAYCCCLDTVTGNCSLKVAIFITAFHLFTEGDWSAAI